MSDSELSEASSVSVPPDFELENSLRREVNRLTANGEETTVRVVRAASEQKLGLPDGFYKGHAVWKVKSKDIVQDQFEEPKDVPGSPELKSKKAAAPRDDTTSPTPRKRKSAESSSPPPKKRKPDPKDSADSSPLSDAQSDSEPPTKKKKQAKKSQPRKKAPTKSSAAKKPKPNRISDDDDEDEEAQDGESKPESDVPDKADSESEMSVVLDEEPKPKKKSKGKSTTAPKAKTTKPGKAKAPAEEDPDQAEIKRLQTWLVRCGIRKVWGAYLKPYESPKAKVKHLKEMLADAGMDGRYSMEKANQIKEARELAADLSAVQEGEQRWGTGGKASSAEDSEDDRPKSRGRLQRGRAHYDFLSSDGEETS